MNATGEWQTSSGSGFSVQSTVKRTGSFALRMNPSSSACLIGFSSRPAGGTNRALFSSVRFYVRIASLPASPSFSLVGFSSGRTLTLNSNGTLNIQSNTSTLAFTADNLWHRVEFACSGSNSEARVDGVQWVTEALGQSASTSLQFGQSAGTPSCDLYIDDIIADDGDFNSTGFPGESSALLLIPTAGNNANSWTDGAGGTGDIHGSVDNIPPVGVAASTASAKIKNAATGTNLDYTATMQTYIAGGVPARSVVNAVMALCNDGEEVTTGTKDGGIWIASNPAQSAAGNTFDYGNDTATPVGTFPTGWITHFGPVTANPSVTLSTAPTVSVRKTTSTNRTVDVDFMGIYVDYTPPSAPTVLKVNQAVNRAASY